MNSGYLRSPNQDLGHRKKKSNLLFQTFFKSMFSRNYLGVTVHLLSPAPDEIPSIAR